MIQAEGPAYGRLGSTTAASVGKPWTYVYDGSGERISTIASIVPIQTIPGTPASVGVGLTASTLQRYSLTDEQGELSTETSTSSPGVSAYDYVYLGDVPVAQIDTKGFGIHYTHTDDQNLPVIQSDPSGNVTYQADYEPFGSVYALRTSGDSHQPIRLPGQTAEQFDGGQNGQSDVFYNNAGWYRPAWARYSQPDPLGSETGGNSYAYSDDTPLDESDASGLITTGQQARLGAWFDAHAPGKRDAYTPKGQYCTNYAEAAFQVGTAIPLSAQIDSDLGGYSFGISVNGYRKAVRPWLCSHEKYDTNNLAHFFDRRSELKPFRTGCSEIGDFIFTEVSGETGYDHVALVSKVTNGVISQIAESTGNEIMYKSYGNFLRSEKNKRMSNKSIDRYGADPGCPCHR